MDFAQRTGGGHNIKGSFSAGAEDVGRGDSWRFNRKFHACVFTFRTNRRGCRYDIKEVHCLSVDKSKASRVQYDIL